MNDWPDEPPQNKPQHRSHEFLNKQLKREKRARKKAEQLAERELRNLHEKQKKIELIKDISQASNEALEPEDAFPRALELIGHYLNWPLGHIWTVSDGEGPCYSTNQWYEQNEGRFRSFQNATENRELKQGEGLPGQILESNRPHSAANIETTEDPRISSLNRLLLQGCLAFPVSVGDQPFAIFEFLTPENHKLQEETLTLFDQVGNQLGEIVERKQARDQIEYLADFDELTGLPNHRQFNNRLTDQLNNLNTSDHLAVIFISFDTFRKIYRAFGHDYGNTLLKHVSSQLKAFKWSNSFLARWGGHQFTIFYRYSEDNRLETRIDQLVDFVESTFQRKSHQFRLYGSLGVSIFPEHGKTPDELVSKASLAMEQAKKRRGSTRVIYRQGLKEEKQSDLIILSNLNNSIKSNDFESFFQPQIDIGEQQIVGVEALMRWKQDGQMHLPGEFISLAETSGLIVDIGWQVIHHAVGTVSQWHEEGYEDVKLSINLSSRELEQRQFLSKLQDGLNQHEFDPSSLVIEITETSLMQNMETTRDRINQLQKWGVEVAIDDFGKGYSSFSYLTKFPVDTLKIDRSFVMNLGQSKETARIVQSIIDMSDQLHLKTIAEGVEEFQQLEQLQSMGVQHIQGYLFAAPQSAQDCRVLLEEGVEAIHSDQHPKVHPEKVED